MATPLVSIIMNCYNGERYLRDALDSVYAQTYSNWEVVFWDNCSTDRSAEIARSYDGRVNYFRAETTTPLGEARNLALARVTGTYVAFLDTDDQMLPGMLETQVGVMEASEYAFVYGGAVIIDERSVERKRVVPRTASGDVFAPLLRHYEVMMPTTVVRRSVLEAEGLGFDTSYQYCPDYNLFMTVAARHDVGVTRAPIVKYRRSWDSLSTKLYGIVSSEVGRTLDRLEAAFPDRCRENGRAMADARAKLRFYDAVNHIAGADYGAARRALASVVWRRWQYLAIYFGLFLPIPQRTLLRALNR